MLKYCPSAARFLNYSDFQQLTTQRRAHPGWRLLAADHAPMIASFLHAAFIKPNVRSIGRQQLASTLDDFLHQLHDRAGETLFPKAAGAYLDDWGPTTGRGCANTTHPERTKRTTTSPPRPSRPSTGSTSLANASSSVLNRA